MKKQKELIHSTSYLSATGPVPFNMTNDYMFRAVNQKNNKVTKGIICAVLHLNEELIQSIKITNPIKLGNKIEEKEFMLDINILLNNSAQINLEMQVINEHNWQERSLSYLCRSFDHLQRGQDYLHIKPAIHVGFLNFHPFPDYPEFHGTYKLTNLKTGMVYSDKFLLNVVDLKYVNLATDTDKEFQVDTWAKFFTATTWEEIIMLAEKNPYIAEAAQTMYEVHADETTELQCRTRQEYYMRQNAFEHIRVKNSELESEIAEKDNLLAEKDNQLSEKDALLSEKDNQLSEKDALLSEKDNQLSEKDALLSEKDNLLSEKDAFIAQLQARLAQKSENE